jgi:hypothetical protein
MRGASQELQVDWEEDTKITRLHPLLGPFYHGNGPVEATLFGEASGCGGHLFGCEKVILLDTIPLHGHKLTPIGNGRLHLRGHW